MMKKKEKHSLSITRSVVDVFTVGCVVVGGCGGGAAD